MTDRELFDTSYVYFHCKECNALFSDTHYFPDMDNYICDDCMDKED